MLEQLTKVEVVVANALSNVGASSVLGDKVYISTFSCRLRNFIHPFVTQLCKAMHTNLSQLSEYHLVTEQALHNISCGTPLGLQVPCKVKLGDGRLVLPSTVSLLSGFERFVVPIEQYKSSLCALHRQLQKSTRGSITSYCKHWTFIANTVDAGHTNLEFLAIALGSAVYFKERLSLFETMLFAGDSHCIALDPLQEIESTIQNLRTQFQNQVLHNCQIYICCDIDKQQWGDCKPWLEGKRCSYGLEMWRIQMHCILRLLCLHLPHYHSKKFFAEVLLSSLQLLGDRYTRICPSRVRAHQYQLDISYLVHSVRCLCPVGVIPTTSSLDEEHEVEQILQCIVLK